MLSLKDFKSKMTQEELLINDSVSKIKGGQKVTTYVVSFDSCGCPSDSGTEEDDLSSVALSGPRK